MLKIKEIELLKKENIKLKEENENLKQSYGVSKSKELKEQLKDQNNIIDDLKNQIEYWRNEKQMVTDKYEKLNAKNISLECKIRDIPELEQKIANLEIELVKSNDYYDEMKDNFKNANQEIEKLKYDISIKNKEIKAYQQAINNISITFQQQEIKELKRSNKNKTNKEK